MAKYTYKDIIIDPEDPRLEIGAEYYFSDYSTSCIEYAKTDNNEFLARLESICSNQKCLFNMGGETQWACLIRKKESEKKYVPFDLSKEEVREKLRGRWVKSNKDSSLFEFQITQFSIVNISNTDIVVINTAVLTVYPEDLLKDYIFIDDNTPCGELVDITSDDGLSEGEK